ncbi:MAG: M13 family metallopeptidase [Sphingobacteriales bacterium]|nr:M13 family metallopeptidase [Sphingobacteriales bacterium]
MKLNDKSIVENMRNANKFWFNYHIGKLNKPVDRTEWDMTPQTYNAYYNPSNNEIVLPAGIFVIPGHKDAEIDDAVIYGYAAASTIGHEITHGFDDEGRQFDDKGNLQNWWQEEDEKKFNEKAARYVDQFNNYVVLDSLHINGKATLGENIADLGGLVIALDAFKKTVQFKEGKTIDGLTPLQRYFLGYALGWLGHAREEELASRVMTDVHSPPFLRVNGPFSNIDDWYDAFGIQKGEKMWRDGSDRVKIW